MAPCSHDAFTPDETAPRGRAIRFHLLACFAAALFVACAPGSDDGSDSEEEPGTQTQEIVGAGRRVCSWNIRRLGHQFNDLPKDMPATAKIIKDNCDVIAVQEVMQTTNFTHTGYDELLAELNPRYWDGVVTESPRPMPGSSNSEHYAFYWRKSAASLCEGWAGVEQYDDADDVIAREPAWACIKLKASPRELVIASYHAVFGDGTYDARREVSLCDDDLDNDGKPDDLFNAMRKSRPSATDVMLVGDFNLSFGEMKDAMPAYVDLTVGNGSTVNVSDEITTNQYDHMMVLPSSPLLAASKPAETLDVRKVATQGYFETVSDHLPLRLVLK